MTMKGIAERAGVGRQTVYRWWSTKAEILFEASVIDAEQELATASTGEPAADLGSYVRALVGFLAHSPAGAAYRALLGEAQYDPAVAELIATKDVVGHSARAALANAAPAHWPASELDRVTALLVGPPFYWIVTGRDPAAFPVAALVDSVLTEVRTRPGR